MYLDPKSFDICMPVCNARFLGDCKIQSLGEEMYLILTFVTNLLSKTSLSVSRLRIVRRKEARLAYEVGL